MINRLQLLRNIGQFESVSTIKETQLSRYVVIYSENGRGKTTISAVLRSLATGDPVHILERRRLASQHPPHVVLDCSGGPPSAMFQNSAWNRTLPNLVIYDDRFVDENVYSGLAVAPEHRQNLHQLVLGAQGVGLSQQLQGAVKQIELDNADIRARSALIPTAAMGGMSADEFCALPMRSDIENEIAVAERALAAAREQGPVRDTPSFDPILLPNFDADPLAEILQRDLPALDTQAAALVQAHIAENARNGESWIADGVRILISKGETPGTCPFCAQDLAGSPVMAHYRAYFSQEYAALKESISASIASIDRLHGREAPASFERAVRVAVERQQFWARFVTVPEVTLDTASIVNDWQAVHGAVIAALETKRAAPLERMAIPQSTLDAITRFEAHRRTVASINHLLAEANRPIQAVKQQAETANSRELQENLNRLKTVETRYRPAIVELCEEYLAAKAAKTRTEAIRNQAKVELETYRTTAFPRYQAGINWYLTRFNAGFQIGRVTPADTRGGPTCNYDIVINNTAVPVSGAVDRRGEPSFRNTLSAGDRNTLALAFFFASLDQAHDLADKIVVIDDPISSLDEHRSLTTVQEIWRLGQRVSQLITLSHNKPFLCRMYEGIDSTMRTSLKIERDASGSTLLPWDVSQDIISEHDRRHQLLTRFHTNGPANDSLEIACSIRPHLEAFLRVACPGTFPPGMSLGSFRGLCDERYGSIGQILDNQRIAELRDLVEYSNRYHHVTNQARETADINDAQLCSYVKRTLAFTKP